MAAVFHFTLDANGHFFQLWGRADGPFQRAWMRPMAGLIWFD